MFKKTAFISFYFACAYGFNQSTVHCEFATRQHTQQTRRLEFNR